VAGNVDSNERFVRAAVRRKNLFLSLSIAGVAVALGLAGWTLHRKWVEPDFALGLRSVVILLILLNSRQNLRQYRYALALERLTLRAERILPQSSARAGAPDGSDGRQ